MMTVISAYIGLFIGGKCLDIERNRLYGLCGKAYSWNSQWYDHAI